MEPWDYFTVPGLISAVLVAVTFGICTYYLFRSNLPFYDRALALLASTLCLTYWFLVSYGSFNLFRPTYLNNAYDSLGRHLLQGSAAVDPSDIDFEAFLVNGKSYMYFGPFPALIRIVLTVLLPHYSNFFAPLSALVAALLSWVAATGCLSLILQSNSSLTSNDRGRLRVLLSSAFGFGTPLFTVLLSNSIYHEAILWAFCGVMSGLFFFLTFNREPRSFPLFLLATSAGVALLSRVTTSISLFILLGAALLRVRRSLPLGRTLFCCLPAILALLFQLWYNFARFNSPVTFVQWESYSFDKKSGNESKRNELGTINLSRIPTAILDYLIPPADAFSSHFPWLVAAPVTHLRPELFFQDNSEKVIPFSLLSLWLFISGGIGLYLVYSKGSIDERILVLAFTPTLLLLFSFYYLAYRYTLDLLPLLYVGTLSSLKYLNVETIKRLRLISVYSTITVLCCLATIVSSFLWGASAGAMSGNFTRQVTSFFESVRN